LAAPAAAAVSAALLARVLPEAQSLVPVLAQVVAPVLAWRQVVAGLAHRVVEPAVRQDLLSRQSFSAAMARRSP
jgi:hypothetical protein